MLNDEVVGRAAVERGLEVAQPLVHKVAVDAVHDGNLLVNEDVGGVGHAVGHDVLALEEVELVVVHANVKDAVCNLLHGGASLSVVVSHPH